MPEMEEEIDIYGDLPEFEKKLCNTVSPGKAKNINEEREELKKQVALLTEQLENVRKLKANLEVNLSSLLKTAKAEIARKDRTIGELRSELDNIAFRRKKPYGKAPQNHVPPVQQTTEIAPRTEEHHTTHETIPAESTFKLNTDHSYYNRDGEEQDEEEEKNRKHHRDQLNRGCSTVFGERLRKRLAEQEELERKQNNAGHLEKVVESDKENNSLSNMETHRTRVSPVPDPIEVDKPSIIKSEDSQGAGKINGALGGRVGTKRPIVEDQQKKNIKRKKVDSDLGRVRNVDEYNSNPIYHEGNDFQRCDDYYKLLDEHDRLKFEVDQIDKEYMKNRNIKKTASDHENRDSPDRHHRRFVDKHWRKDRQNLEYQIPKRERLIPDSWSNDFPTHKNRNDHRSDSDRNGRYWNKYKEDYYEQSKYDRRTHQKQHNSERYHNNHSKKNYIGKSDNRHDIRYLEKDEMVSRRESSDSRSYLNKMSKRHSSERRNGSNEDNIRREEKYMREELKSRGKSSDRDRKRRRSNTSEDRKSDVTEKQSNERKNRRSRSFEKQNEELKAPVCEDKEKAIDKVSEDVMSKKENLKPEVAMVVKDSTGDLEDGETISDTSLCLSSSSEIIVASAEYSTEKNGNGEEKNESGEQENVSGEQENEIGDQENEIDKQKNEMGEQKNEISQQKNEISVQKNEISEQKNEISMQKNEISVQKNEIDEQKNEIDEQKIEESVELVQKDEEAPKTITKEVDKSKEICNTDSPPKSVTENVNQSKTDVHVSDSTPNAEVISEDMDISDKHPTLPKSDSTRDANDEIIGIFGDGKDTTSLTNEIQRERENNLALSNSPKTANVEIPASPKAKESLASSSLLNLNDSIEKKLERMENSEVEPNSISEFFGNFRAGDDLEAETNEKKAKEAEKLEEDCCSASDTKDPTAKKDCSNGETSKASISSISSSSASSTTSSSTSSSLSTSCSSTSSSSSESEEVDEDESKKEETAGEERKELVEESQVPTASNIEPNSVPVAVREEPAVEESVPIVNSVSPVKESSKSPLKTKDELTPTVNSVPTPISPAKPNRKAEVTECSAPPKVNGRVVVVVRRRRPVRLSNNNTPVIVSPKCTNSSPPDSKNLPDINATSKPRPCRTPRLKNS